MKKIIILFCGTFILTAGLLNVTAKADDASSRQMKIAVRLYNEKQYHAAMDKFFDVISNGSQEEVHTARLYVDRINKKLQGLGSEDDEEEIPLPAASSSAAQPAAPRPVADDRITGYTPSEVRNSYIRPAGTIYDPSFSRGQTYVASDAQGAPAAQLTHETQSGVTPATSDKESQEAISEILPKGGELYEQMRRQELSSRIHLQLEQERRDLLTKLAGIRGVQIYTMNPTTFEVISIDPDMMINSSGNVTPTGVQAFDLLTAIMFTMGDASITVVPRNVPTLKADIEDLRQAMVLDNYLVTGGVSPARIKVLSAISEADAVKLANIRGIAIMNRPDAKPNLSAIASMSTDSVPSITLGVQRKLINPAKDEGLVIEFSALETAAKIGKWTFEIIRKNDNEIIRRISGIGPVYQQVYWNGRQDFFGPPLYDGIYDCIFTVIDSTDNRNILTRSVELKSGTLAKTAASVAAKTAAGSAKASANPKARELNRPRPQRKAIGAVEAEQPVPSSDEEEFVVDVEGGDAVVTETGGGEAEAGEEAGGN